MPTELTMDIGGREVSFAMEFDMQCMTDINTWYFLSRDQCCEPEVAHLMARVLQPGDLCVDGGANIGFFTLLMSRLVGSTGTVIACEPGKNNLAKLELNLSINGVENIELVVNPLWSWEKPVTLYLNPDGGKNSLTDHLEKVDREELDATTLDIVLKGRQPKLIKLDCEGAEYDILLGLLDTCPPYLLCEMNRFALERAGRTPHLVREQARRDMFLLHRDGSFPSHVPRNVIPAFDDENTMVLFATWEDVLKAWPKVTS